MQRHSDENRRHQPTSFSMNSKKAQVTSKICSIYILREGSRYQIGGIFGKNPNGLQPPLFSVDCIEIFYDRYGCIYARMYDGQIV